MDVLVSLVGDIMESQPPLIPRKCYQQGPQFGKITKIFSQTDSVQDIY